MPVELRPKDNPTHVVARVRIKVGSTPAFIWDVDKLALAEAWHDAAKQAIKEGNEYPPPSAFGSRSTVDEEAPKAALNSNWTLKQAYTKALEKKWAGKNSEAKQAAYYKVIAGFFGHNKRFSDITWEDLDAFIGAISVNPDTGRPRSNATINRHLSTLSVMWKLANSYQKAPIRIGPWPILKETGSRTAILTPEYEQNMFEACKQLQDTEMRDFLMILLDTGMRRGEVERLRVGDIAEKDLLILERFTTKNGDARSVVLTPRTQKMVARRAKGKKPHEKLFPINTNTIRHRFDRIKDAAQLPKEIVMHSLRHTFASRLARTGKVSLYDLKEMLGHRSIQATQIYAHLCTGSLRRASNLLSESPEYSSEEHDF
ncbi:tyrosine-type recombinase/integrase [Bacterioplanoides sp.]|uniref:tyrosine-type recombinase/integrase n=1 Tax=Bacterioplanoides sp. TaxID=2066072 RepID=UPI003AFF99E0